MELLLAIDCQLQICFGLSMHGIPAKTPKFSVHVGHPGPNLWAENKYGSIIFMNRKMWEDLK